MGEENRREVGGREGEVESEKEVIGKLTRE
jgi:hypothetical protein